jgi:hypothetical protein
MLFSTASTCPFATLIAATVPLERELKIMKLASRLALPRLQFLHPLLHSVRSLLISYRVTPKMNPASFNNPEAILPSNPRYHDRMTHPDLDTDWSDPDRPCKSYPKAEHWGGVMPRVLLVGFDRETVDFSNPALPSGMSVEEIRAGIVLALKQTTDRGCEGDVCLIRPDQTVGQTVERHLASANYDCVAIAAGVRLPPQGLALFEVVVNAVP